MVLTFLCVGIAAWALYMGMKFYRRMDWDEPPESSPDFGQMHKRQTELLRIRDVLRQAHEQGKLSPEFIEEYNRFADRDRAEMEAAEKAWQESRNRSRDQA